VNPVNAANESWFRHFVFLRPTDSFVNVMPADCARHHSMDFSRTTLLFSWRAAYQDIRAKKPLRFSMSFGRTAKHAERRDALECALFLQDTCGEATCVLIQERLCLERIAPLQA
jgi:hypothetical protein